MSYIYVPSKAEVPARVQIRGDMSSLKRQGDVHICFAAIKPSKRSDDILFTIDNEFEGPYLLHPIKKSSSSFNTILEIENALPLKQIDKTAYCSIPDWACNELLLSGHIQQGGYIPKGVKMCAITYRNYSTVILKGEDIYNKIMNKV